MGKLFFVTVFGSLDHRVILCIPVPQSHHSQVKDERFGRRGGLDNTEAFPKVPVQCVDKISSKKATEHIVTTTLSLLALIEVKKRVLRAESPNFNLHLGEIIIIKCYLLIINNYI